MEILMFAITGITVAVAGTRVPRQLTMTRALVTLICLLRVARTVSVSIFTLSILVVSLIIVLLVLMCAIIMVAIIFIGLVLQVLFARQVMVIVTGDMMQGIPLNTFLILLVARQT
jgi:hypothetical protein